MKRKILLPLFALVLLSTGCATTVVGPVSYATARSNKKAAIRRAAIRSKTLTAEQKSQIFELTALTVNHTEIAVGVGVNVTELLYGDYTWGEVAKQFAGVAADGGIYTALYLLAEELADGSDSDSGGGVNITGDGNNVNVTQGDSNSSTSDENESSSGGSSNLDDEIIEP
jgi:hypothetical protein